MPFFMHPNNCSEIFNSVTLSTWRKFWTDMSLDEINGELKEALIKYYDEYISITPFESINKKLIELFSKTNSPERKSH